MKSKLLILIVVVIFPLSLSAQEKGTSYLVPDTTRYSTPLFSRIVNENIYWSNKDFRWKNFISGFLSITYTNKPSGFFRTDLFAASHRFFGFNLLSLYTFDFPMNINKSKFYNQLLYVFPIGLRVPLLNGKNFDLSAEMDYYWPVNFRKMDHDSMYYEYNILLEGAQTTYKNSPQILDFKVELKLCILKNMGISAMAGFRSQLSSWYGTNYGSVIYRNDISGLYFGLSVSLTYFTASNKGVEAWKDAVTENKGASYRKFITDFPASHYNKEAIQRMEDRLYLDAINGTDAECTTYLAKYKAGKYLPEVKKRLDEIEESFYARASSGTPADCDFYLNKYPSGKYLANVKNLKEQKLDRIDSTDFAKAVTGTITDCDEYIRIHNDGKYVSQARAEKNNKIEFIHYSKAKEGSYEDCDYYLSSYPAGRYANEISSLRNERFAKAEEEIYKRVKETDYTGCVEYLANFREGKHFKEVDLMCQYLKYTKGLTWSIELKDPLIENIEITGKEPDPKRLYGYDVVVVRQKGSIVEVNARSSMRRVFEVISAPMSNSGTEYTSFGLEDSKIDITLMTGGLVYDGRIWYPTAKRDAIIIIDNKKITGYNVRYVRKN
jgi:hypothetical protein